MTKNTPFKLYQYLKSDLERAALLMGSDSPSGWTLFKGFFSPRFMPVFLCRLAYFFNMTGLAPVAKMVSIFNFIVFGIEVSLKCEIGPGLFFPHTSGIVIGAFSIGSNATIYQGVTIGARELDFLNIETSRPTIGSYVTISTGAVILGSIKVGDRAVIGANSVVLTSIPNGALAVGAPARIVKDLN